MSAAAPVVISWCYCYRLPGSQQRRMDVIHLRYDAYRPLRHNVATYVLCMFAAFYTALQPALYSGIGKATESRSVNMLVYRTRESGVGGYMNQFAIRSLRDPFFRCSDQLCQAQVRPITEIIQPLSSLATLPSKSRHGSEHNILF